MGLGVSRGSAEAGAPVGEGSRGSWGVRPQEGSPRNLGSPVCNNVPRGDAARVLSCLYSLPHGPGVPRKFYRVVLGSELLTQC